MIVTGVIIIPLNPGTGKYTKGHLAQHKISSIEGLMCGDVYDTTKSLPRTRNPFFTFPKKLLSLDANDGMFLLITKQNYFPINLPTAHVQSVLLTDMPCLSLTGFMLLDMKKISLCPFGHASQRLAIFSTSPIPSAVLLFI